MKRIALSFLILSVIFCAVAHAETREEARARLSAISAQCAERTNEYYFGEEAQRASDCLRIGSLRDDLLRCAHERNHLRIAAGCSHQWRDIGPGSRWCRECRSIAHFLGGEWQVTFTGGLWVGPDPLRYPKEYGLERDTLACSHRWIESAKGTKFCEKCGVYAMQHINGDWLIVPGRGRWIGTEPK